MNDPRSCVARLVMLILSGVSHSLVPGEKIIPGALLVALAPHLVAKPAA